MSMMMVFFFFIISNARSTHTYDVKVRNLSGIKKSMAIPYLNHKVVLQSIQHHGYHSDSTLLTVRTMGVEE